MSTEVAPVAIGSTVATPVVPAPQGMRKNGKQWHEPRKAFRPKAGNNSFEKRQREKVAYDTIKAKVDEMKKEKEETRQARIAKIKEKRAGKIERERYAKLAETMHKKRVERLKKKEKRNKMLKS